MDEMHNPNDDEINVTFTRRELERLLFIARFTAAAIDRRIIDVIRRALANGKHHQG